MQKSTLPKPRQGTTTQSPVTIQSRCQQVERVLLGPARPRSSLARLNSIRAGGHASVSLAT
eukprot:3226972-Rhodomonas_salina.1